MKHQNLVLILIILLASPVLAGRYHVSSGGQKTEGFSIAQNWDPDNCYQQISTAAVMATMSDTILIDYGIHPYHNSNTLPALIANRDMSNDNSNTSVVLRAYSRFLLNPNQQSSEIRGITFTAEDIESNRPLFDLAPEDGSLDYFLISSCRFFNLNSSSQGADIEIGGGVVRAQPNTGYSVIRISNSEFIHNYCRGDGGAIAIADGWNVIISGSNFIGNHSHKAYDDLGLGGAIVIDSIYNISSLSLSECYLDSNYAFGPGGGISVGDGNMTISSSQILNSISGWESDTGWKAGAGIFMRATNPSHDSSRTFIMNDCIVSGNVGYPSENTGAGDGGGLIVKGIIGHMIDISINDSVFENNYNMQGGGAYIGRFSNAVINRCIFRNNRTYFTGGGSFKGGAFADCLGETAEYNYCSFIGNEAGVDPDGNILSSFGWGGAFCTRLYPRATFTNCTFLNNGVYGDDVRGDAIYAHEEGGTFNDPEMMCVIDNCLFWGTAGSDYQINVPDNAIESTTNCAFGPGEFICGGVTPVNTVELTSNPCVSLTDISLVYGSPCIDMAFPTEFTIDLFGTPLPQGNLPDIGAMEYIDVSSVPSTSPAGNLVVSPAYPNPFNPMTIIRYSVIKECNLAVKIVDINGQILRSMPITMHSAGNYSTTWDGKDSSGKLMPAGQYLAVFQAGQELFAQKLMLIK